MYSKVSLLDGKQWGYSQYILLGQLSKCEKTRYIIPVNVDDTIDLKK